MRNLHPTNEVPFARNFPEKIAMSGRREITENSCHNLNENHKHAPSSGSTTQGNLNCCCMIAPHSIRQRTYAVVTVSRIFQENDAMSGRPDIAEISKDKQKMSAQKKPACGTYPLQTKFQVEEISQRKLPCPGGERWKKITVRKTTRKMK